MGIGWTDLCIDRLQVWADKSCLHRFDRFNNKWLWCTHVPKFHLVVVTSMYFNILLVTTMDLNSTTFVCGRAAWPHVFPAGFDRAQVFTNGAERVADNFSENCTLAALHWDHWAFCPKAPRLHIIQTLSVHRFKRCRWVMRLMRTRCLQKWSWTLWSSAALYKDNAMGGRYLAELSRETWLMVLPNWQLPWRIRVTLHTTATYCNYTMRLCASKVNHFRKSAPVFQATSQHTHHGASSWAKEIISDLEESKYQHAEWRLSIYGRNQTEMTEHAQAMQWREEFVHCLFLRWLWKARSPNGTTSASGSWGAEKARNQNVWSCLDKKKAAGIIHKGACCCRRRRTLAVPEHPLDDPDPTLVCLVTQQHKICTGCFKDIGRFWNFDLKVSGSHKSQGLVKMTLTLQGTKQPDSWTTSARC